MLKRTLQSGGLWLLCFLAIGLPFWNIPYSAVEIPTSLLTPALAVLMVSAYLLCLQPSVSVLATTTLLGSSVPAAVLLRVIVECMADPTAHNLWPFEVVFAIMLSLPCALAGAWLGRLAGRHLFKSQI